MRYSTAKYNAWLLGEIRKSLTEINDREWDLIFTDLARYLLVERERGLFNKKANDTFYALRSKARSLQIYLYVPHNRF